MRLINLDHAVKSLEQAYPNDGQMSCHDAVAVIATLPTIEPRKKGKWERHGKGLDGYWECTNCHYASNTFDARQYNYCPSCGADMREGGEDEAD